MTALAVAYQVQCRLSDVAAVRAAGFDHTVQGAYAVAAGVARVLGLDACSAANAIAISGTALNALRVTRTGKLSHWKGLAYPHMAACSTAIVFLARLGITGPLEAIEGEKGLMDAITGLFEIDWSREDLERVKRTILKKHNAEIHSQTAIEGVLTLKQRHQFKVDDIEQVNLEIFDVAYNIIGGGDEGDKTSGVSTKEQADHSLPYILAVAILDGQVTPEQYRLERIRRSDVQELLRRVTVSPNAAYSQRFPNEMPCRIGVRLRDGRTLSKEMRDYPGFFTQPMTWDMAFEKFERLAPGNFHPARTLFAASRVCRDGAFNLRHPARFSVMVSSLCEHYRRNPETAHVRHHLASGCGQDHAHGKAAALRRRGAARRLGHRPEKPARHHVRLDGTGKETRHFDQLHGVAI